MPMTVTSDSITGAELAERLLQGVGNERMRAATRLLGAHRDGYWLRRLADDQELAAAIDQPFPPFIDSSGTHPSVEWSSVGLLLITQPWALKCSASELAVLEFAASLVGRCGVNLEKALIAVDGKEFDLLARAMREAVYGDPC